MLILLEFALAVILASLFPGSDAVLSSSYYVWRLAPLLSVQKIGLWGKLKGGSNDARYNESWRANSSSLICFSAGQRENPPNRPVTFEV